jgi:glutamate/tyrosine decarboxylase-like PLP-dependent enzyme
VPELSDHLHDTVERIIRYRREVDELPVWPAADFGDVVAGFDRPLADEGLATEHVVAELVAAAERGLVACTGPRYFGFVTGGSTDASLCADLLVSAWDQNAFNGVSSPAALAAEVVAGRWLKELLGLPTGATVGFVTGAQGANTVALAAARHHVLAAAGWDVADAGLFGAPAIVVLAGEERHATIDRSLRLLGLGSRALQPVATTPQGALDADALAAALDGLPAETPTIVCAQAGNVASGAFDDLVAICASAHERGAWVHVDGAFGLWAAASPSTRHLTAGVELADSWACDGHKWLNVPYDSGFVVCAHPDAHAAAMHYLASYLVGQGSGPPLGGADLTPESSRRARGIPVWAAIRALGRDGVAELVDRCCRLARRFADVLGAVDGIEVCNDVVLNQVLVRFADDDDRTDAVTAHVQAEGTCWMGPATWRGRRVMRLSVSNWSTTEADVDRSAAAIVAAHRALAGRADT